jgi:hypothetical protein
MSTRSAAPARSPTSSRSCALVRCQGPIPFVLVPCEYGIPCSSVVPRAGEALLDAGAIA